MSSEVEVDAEAISNDPTQHQHSTAYQPYHDARPPTSAGNPSVPTPPMDPDADADAEDEEPIQPPKDFNEHFPAHLPVPPFIHVQGVPNFRDLGGYPCPPPPSLRSGGAESSKKFMVRKNLLFRCAHPTQLTSHGAATLRNLGITNIYDLRSAPEIDKLAHTPPASPTSTGEQQQQQQPPLGKPKQPTALDTSNGYIVIPGVPREFTPVYEREDYSPVALARKLQWYTSPNSPDKAYSEGFVNAYRDIATYAARGGAYARILRQTLRSAENMVRNPGLGGRRRPTSAFANLDFLMDWTRDSGENSPVGSRKVSRSGGGSMGDKDGDGDGGTAPAADGGTHRAPDREKKDGGLIFHCTAGKDRTGVLAAVILRLLGVDEDTICWEYAITEPGLGSWRNLFIDRISKGGLGGPNKEQAYRKEQDDKDKEAELKRKQTEVGPPGNNRMMSRAEASRICGSRAANMRAWMAEVLEGEFGGSERYLLEMVGLSELEVQQLKEKLVVEVKEEGEVTVPRGIKGWSLERGMEDDYVDADAADDGSGAEKEGGGVGSVMNGQERGKLGLDESAGREKEEKVMTG